MAGPRTQPSDVKSPIPSETLAVQREAAERFGTEIEQVTLEAGGAERSIAATETGQVASADGPAGLEGALERFRQQSRAASDELDTQGQQLNNKLQSAVQNFKAERLATAQREEEPTVVGQGAGIAPRLIAKIGRSPEEQQRLLQRFLGDKFDTRVKGTNVQFKKKGARGFEDLDPTGFDSIGEFFADIFVDLAPELAETAISVGAEAGGALTGGPAGFLAGAVAGPAAAAGLRQQAVEAFDVEPTETALDEIKTAVGFNLGFLGAGAIARPIAKRAIGAVKQAFQEGSAVTRVKDLAKFQKSITEFSDDIGVRPDLKGTLSETGESIDSALKAQNELLGREVGLIWRSAQDAAGGPETLALAPKFRDGLMNLFEDFGVSVHQNAKTGKLQAVFPQEAGIGFQQGQLKKLGAIFERLERAVEGAMTIRDMRQTLTDLGKMGFKSRGDESFRAGIRRLRGNLADDRNQLFQDVLAGKPEGEFFKDAFQNYTSKIDLIDEFRDTFRRGGSGEKFVKSFIKPDRSDLVRDVKFLLGENSNEFKSIRGAWIEDLLERSSDKKFGILDGDKFLTSLQKTGQDTLDELLPKGQQEFLKTTMKKISKIPLADILGNNTAQQQVKDAAVLLVSQGQLFPRTKAAMFFRLFGSSKRAMELIEEGLVEVAEKEARPAQRGMIMETLGAIRQRARNTKFGKTVGQLREATPVQAKETIAAEAAGALEQEAENEGQALSSDLKRSFEGANRAFSEAFQ